MKGKNLVLLLVVVGVLAAVWSQMSRNEQKAWSGQSKAGSKIVEFSLNDVSRMRIKTKGAEVNLVRKDDAWTVSERHGFPADFDLVSRLLRKFWELKSVQDVRAGASQFARLQVVEPDKEGETGTLVTLLGAGDTELSAIIVGKTYKRDSDGEGGFSAGRYVRAQSSQQVHLVSELFEDVNSDPSSWLSKEFLSIDGVRSVAVSGERAWQVSRESTSGEWKLADLKVGENFDAKKVASLANLLGPSAFSDVFKVDEKPEVVNTAVVETFDGFRYELKVGREENGSYPLLVQVGGTFAKERVAGADEKEEDKKRLDEEFASKLKGFEAKLAREKKLEAWRYWVPRFRLDGLMKERAALMADKPAEEKK